MYQRIGKAAYKANLDNTIALLKALGNPEDAFKNIHIAGTNGKGSTSHMLASIFQEAGYKTGLYTSPHLIDFRERIKIDGKLIPEEEVVEFISSTQKLIEDIQPSFFELTVALAFLYFKKEKVDIAIIETGLGGRLDSTNVIKPELSIITNIGMDHMQFLGNDLISIGREKGGIIKQNTPVVIGHANEELKVLFQDIALSKKAPIIFAEEMQMSHLKSDLLGSYQKQNIQTSVVSASILQKLGWRISEENIQQGLLKVRENTGLAGRWDIIQEQPKVICDTGHNHDGLVQVLHQLQKEKFKQLHIVLGMVNDKEISDIIKLFPPTATYYFCQASVPRSLAVESLYEEAQKVPLSGHCYKSVESAYTAALSMAHKDDLVFVGGSTFVVADLLGFLTSSSIQ
jgi:dihydrofolate synthase/folylpolyglutamate synthase